MFPEITRLLRQGWLLYIASNYDPDSDTLAKPSDTNMVSSIATIEGSYTFHKLAYFQNFSVNHAREDEQTTQFDDCDKASSISARFTPSFNMDLFWVNDFDLMKLIMSTAMQNVSGTLVTWATQSMWGVGGEYSVFYPIANQNYNGATISITSLATTTPVYVLISWTDYELVESNGVWGIVFLNSGNYSVTNTTIVLTYDYTPKASSIIGYRSEAIATPLNLFKFVSCDDPYQDNNVDKLKTNTVYITKSFLNSEYVEAFANLANGELKSAGLTFTVDKWWNYYHKKATVNA